MKKKYIVLFLIAALMLTMVACGGGEDDAEEMAKYVGTWNLNLHDDGEEIMDMREFFGEPLAVLVLNEDGTGEIKFTGEAGEPLTWKLDGEGIYIETQPDNEDEEPLVDEMNLNEEGNLELHDGDGGKFILEKVTEAE